MKTNQVIVVHADNITAYEAKAMIEAGIGVNYMPPQDFVDILFRNIKKNEKTTK